LCRRPGANWRRGRFATRWQGCKSNRSSPRRRYDCSHMSYVRRAPLAPTRRRCNDFNRSQPPPRIRVHVERGPVRWRPVRPCALPQVPHLVAVALRARIRGDRSPRGLRRRFSFGESRQQRERGRAARTCGCDAPGTPGDPGRFSHDGQQPRKLPADLEREQCRRVHCRRRLARARRDQRQVVDRQPVQQYRVRTRL
jgi:hypothetical protein